MIPKTTLGAGLALTALVACLFPTEGCGCPPALGVGVVAGLVQRADGTPAPNALVRSHASLHGCLATESDIVDSGLALTGPTGFYRYEIRTGAPTDTACVRLTAVDTAGGRQDSVTVAGIRMRLIPSYGTKERADSVRVDLLLP